MEETEEKTETEKAAKPKKKGQVKKYIFSISIMVLVSALAVYYVLQGDTAEIIRVLGEAKVSYFMIMILLVVLCFCLEGATLTVLTKMYKRRYRWYQGVLNGLIGSFFSAITPFSSGGQFVQAYTFSKQGVNPADGASILVMLFIVSQGVIILYNIAALIFGYDVTIKNMTNVAFSIGSWNISFSPIWLAFIGFGCNIFSMAMLLFLSYSKLFHRFILNTVVGIGAKLRIIKNPAEKKASLAAQIATFRIEVSRLFHNIPVFLLAIFLEVLKWTCFNMSPYFAGMALGADMTGQFMPCLWASAYSSMVTSFIPLPGGSGGAEYAFYLLFTNIYKDATITSAANLLNRSVTFYLTLFIGFVVFASYKGSPRKNISNIDLHKTFVELQIVSLTQNISPNGTMSNGVPVLKKIDNSTIKTYTDLQGATDSDSFLTSEKSSQTIKKKKPWWRAMVERKKKSVSGTPSQDAVFLTTEQINSSFERIKETLIMNQKSIYEEDSPIVEESKAELKQAYVDADNLEQDANSNRSTTEDLRIEAAIKADLADLEAREEKKKKKKEAREKRRENKEARKKK